jgi:hypothetical protein
MTKDPQIELHKRWLGYLQPQGLVVAPAALVDSQALLNENVMEPQQRLRALLVEVPISETERKLAAPSLKQFCVDLLGWRATDLVAGTEAGIEVPLPEYHETLRPEFAVKHPEPAPDPQQPWQLLLQVLPHGTPPDQAADLDDNRQWQASHHARFERLLRESKVHAGVLFFGTGLRLVYAPKGESSGYLDFPFASMVEVSGRPILAALLLLLDHNRLFNASPGQTLPDLFEKSRKYQNKVSTELAEQVLAALHELLRGFQSAHAHSGERLLQEWIRSHPDDIYGGLLTVILRLIFLLYAEDRGLLGNEEAWHQGYSVLGLYERLRSDADRFPDTMDNRFGAWAQLLAVFRLVFDGAKHGKLQLPPREGYLFHPDGGDGVHYQFLEGRTLGEARQVGVVISPPRISDRVVWEVLHNLMVLDGERISYRTLNVEQIGSVYETMMGFRFERTTGPSIAIKPQKAGGAATFVNLLELLDQPAGKRAAWLKDNADCKVTDKADAALKAAQTPEDVALALGKRVSHLTPAVLPGGSFVLQPSDARRKSGSHYTPPQLTQPIVATTLRPILEQLGERPTADQLLELKVCDPAMGSGAFLVEVCRQLGACVVKAWADHPGSRPPIPPDEDELLFAKRLVAQRCLYGVDKNPFAVALAKLSLWLETFAKEHAFTFVDHALRCGDSLVGLSKAQIAAFHWDVSKRGAFVETLLKKKLKEVEAARAKILEAGEATKDGVLRRWLRDADEAMDDLRLIGDLVVAGFFGETNEHERETTRTRQAERVGAWLRAGSGASADRESMRREVTRLREGPQGVAPFHWEIEFPEAYSSDRPGFNAVLGNPPFLGGRLISGTMGDSYLDWLLLHARASVGQADLAAHFVDQARRQCCSGGTLGLVTTNSISQGDTGRIGLGRALQTGATLYDAISSAAWPGNASVSISSFCMFNGPYHGRALLNGRAVHGISAYFKPIGLETARQPLLCNKGRASKGFDIGGDGFLMSRDEYRTFASRHREELSVIKPHINGMELHAQPEPCPNRYVINFLDFSLAEASRYPAALERIRRLAKPYRDTVKRKSTREQWWLFNENRPGMRSSIQGLDRALVKVLTSNTWAFAFLPSDWSCDQTLVVFAMSDYASFSILQSRTHETWALWSPSTMRTDARYTIASCFTNFPLPRDQHAALDAAGKAYYELRADLMVRNNEGLTKTYNRFHDPDEPNADIKKLRELHAAMDRAVLDAYGWTDLHPTHEFLLDYEEEDDDEDTGRTRKRKKPWRYRWPDAFRDEVLARLLKLNQERAEQERLQPPPAKEAKPGSAAPKKNSSRPRKGDPTPSLFKDDPC